MLGAYFSMNLSPFLSSRYAPSPRAASEISTPAAGQSGRVVLHHLHVHQAGPRVVRQGYAVSGYYQCVGAGLEHPAQAAGAEDDRLGPDGVHLPGAYFQRRNAAHLPVLLHQAGDEPLLVAADPPT